ncbi:MAG: GntR family transcriptional regulator [Planctomycetota bacterium]
MLPFCDSPVPVYEQITEHLSALVASGAYRPGEAIPSIRTLAARLVVNPNTVQRTFQELERLGVIEMRRGLGAFVAPQGDVAARALGDRAVYARFLQGIHLGRTSQLPDRDICSIFSRAFDTTKDAGSGRAPLGGVESKAENKV